MTDAPKIPDGEDQAKRPGQLKKRLTGALARLRESAAPLAGRASAAATKYLPTVLGANPNEEKANPYAPYLSRSILLEEAAPPKNARAVINIVSATLAAFVLLASVATLDERAVANGEILPLNFVQPVQHLEGGIVSAVLVEEGEIVKEGQILISMDDTAARSELETLLARYSALNLQIERLRAFAAKSAPDFETIAPDHAQLVHEQREVYLAQVGARKAQIGVIQSQIEQSDAEVAGLNAQAAALSREVGFAREEVQLRKTLLDKGLTSRVVYLNAQRQLARAEGQLAEIQTRKARSKANKAEAAERMFALKERLRNEALGEMGGIASERSQVGEQLARLEDRMVRTSITAPVDGIVKGLVVTSAGTIIGPGSVIMEIVPSSRELVAAIRISPRDVGHLSVGKEAILKIETFNYARYGGITGHIKQISASSFRDEDGNPYFRGLVSLDQDYVGPDPLANRITPGMTLVADIKTGEKSLIGYLLRPVYNTLNDSFGER
ncbi:MAG: HlyD family type I secretion periplasmic adaptor subunit [Proteobacteria bacterium]|nr:HlyD family type I secretion periplasmic adaptor subunit [Pseudomonadota bacterium]